VEQALSHWLMMQEMMIDGVTLVKLDQLVTITPEAKLNNKLL